MFFIVCVLWNFAMFTGKHLCWSLKVCNFTKKRLQHRCFPMNITKLFKNQLFIEHLRWPLLKHQELQWVMLSWEDIKISKKITKMLGDKMTHIASHKEKTWLQLHIVHQKLVSHYTAKQNGMQKWIISKITHCWKRSTFSSK